MGRARILLSAVALVLLLGEVAPGPQPAQADWARHGGAALNRQTVSTRLFAGPTYIALDSHGDVYVADTGRSRVEKISPSGRLIPGWAQQAGRAELATPVGVALDAQGDVYVSDATRRQIDKLAPDGRILGTWALQSGRTQVRGPGGMTVGPDGTVYLVDQVADQVIKLSPRGRILARWGKQGSARGRFVNPHGIATDRHGNVYIADYGNRRIVKLSSTGRVLAVIGAGKFDEDEAPQAVAVDSHGDVYAGAGGVMKFSPVGGLLGKWTRYGAHHTSLAGAFGVAVDRRGNVYVIDQPGRALVKLSPAGATLAVWR